MIIIPPCRDPEVRERIEEYMLIGPYSQPEFQKTPGELIDALVAEFGERRTADVAIWIH
jgi:hypothetical protein